MMTNKNFKGCPLHDRGLTLSILNGFKLTQGFSYPSEVVARGLLNLERNHLNYQNWENLMPARRTG